ncbi:MULTISPECIES: hypothetical protein [unclassified Corynebacterium]|uniref:hypothetical protein n=1 Tax=unclassified Corynebacterium TaxID=2624378 RepID=UPI000421BF62|nr:MULTISPECIES: hypothetical protein [unclassified Corynebacterium]MDK8658918.1 hypothetical protein [Corynebacterium sp. MSK204]MDK8814207.1 hypothetical protein [Corynebacterium sp. MSK073]
MMVYVRGGQAVLNALADAAGLGLDLSAVDEDASIAAIVGETSETEALSLGSESVAISQLVEAWFSTLRELFGYAVVGANSVVG